MEPDLPTEIARMKQSFFDEGFLDQAQFEQLEHLQDQDNPNFVQEIFTIYFSDTIRQFGQIEEKLNQEPASTQKEIIYTFLHRLKGSVVSIGALKTLNEVKKTMQFLQEDDMEGTKAAFQQVKVENENLKVKVEHYYQLVGQVGLPGAAGSQVGSSGDGGSN